jgi:medium-chain acyl-[acyl-carrier-protein] hydrolase
MIRRWLARVEPRADAPTRMFLFPFAGGAGNVFRDWPGAFGAAVEVLPVQLPGREERFGEPPFTRIDPLADAIATALLPLADRPAVLFGWSMGASLAHAVARRWEAAGRVPALLIAGANSAPHLAYDRPHIHDLPGEEFWRGVADLGGLPGEVLADRELRDLVEPTLRADFAVVETRPRVPPRALSCPVAAIAAGDDRSVEAARVAAWNAATRGASTLISVSGGHFAVRDAAPAVRAAVADALRWAGIASDGGVPRPERRLTLRDLDLLTDAG